jgi:hypothetical protein
MPVSHFAQGPFPVGYERRVDFAALRANRVAKAEGQRRYLTDLRPQLIAVDAASRAGRRRKICIFLTGRHAAINVSQNLTARPARALIGPGDSGAVAIGAK